MKFYISILLFIFSLFSFAQKKNIPIPKSQRKITACDCINAIEINPSITKFYGPTEDSKGFGNVQEITIKEKSSKYFFEEEHNTSWYLITMNYFGEFLFEITPRSDKDDYDFLLFKYDYSTFCEKFYKREVTPVRTNIAKGSTKEKGKTGLSSNAKNYYAVRGKGDPFSKSLHVNRGEKYILVLDNVGPEFKGYSISFIINRKIELDGIVKTDDGKPIGAEITLEDDKGNIILRTKSDPITGEYKIKAEYDPYRKYFLSFETQRTFFYSIQLDLDESLETYTKEITLKLLKAKTNYIAGNISFYPAEAEFLSYSESSLKKIYELMTRFPKMIIEIEGHIDGNGGPDAQGLSEKRAKAVYDYLSNKGIAKERMSTIGYSNR